MKTFKYKLYTNAKDGYLDQIINCCGIVYNHCIALHKRYYKIYHSKINSYNLIKHLTKLKRRNKFKDIMSCIPSQSLQNIVERIDKAYSLFFSNLKRKIKCAPPGFKKVKKYKSFTLKQAGYSFNENKIRICKRYYGFFKSRDFEGTIKTITIKRDAVGDFFIFITTDAEDSMPIAKSGKSVGFDFGMMTFLTASDYNDIKAPLFLKKNIKKLKELSRRLSLKKEKSNNRKKARISLAKFQRRVADMRNDFQWKLAKKLCLEYDTMCFETLNMKWMQKEHGKKVNDYGFSDFMSKLEYLAKKYDKAIIYINRFYPSTKTCSVCGYKNDNLVERDREWNCPECHTHHDRDRNAAFNILRVGTSTLSGDDVKPEFLGSHCRC